MVYWTWTPKIPNYLTGLELILCYSGVRLEKYLDYLTVFGLTLWYIGHRLEKHLE